MITPVRVMGPGVVTVNVVPSMSVVTSTSPLKVAVIVDAVAMPVAPSAGVEEETKKVGPPPELLPPLLQPERARVTVRRRVQTRT